MFASIVGEGKLTAVMNVVLLVQGITIERLKDDIAKPLKERKPTVSPKTVVGMV